VAPTYQYEYAYWPPSRPPRHGAELRFIFGFEADSTTDESVRKQYNAMQEY